MDAQGLPEDFAALAPAEQQRILKAADALTRYVFRRTTSVIIAGTPGPTARVRNGSGFVLELNSTPYLGTAWHVVESWQQRRAAGEDVQFQVGRAVLAPDADRLWKDPENDIAFVRLDPFDCKKIDSVPVEPIREWPPVQPKVGEYVLISGFPSLFRTQRSADELDFAAISTMLQVKATGRSYIACQFEREHWIASDWDKVPPPGADLGGISGGPVLHVQNLSYPLVGMASQFSRSFEILYIRTLEHLPPSLNNS